VQGPGAGICSDLIGEVSLRYVLAFVALALVVLLASAPLLASIVGWVLGRHRYVEIAREAAPLISPAVTAVLTIGSLGVAAFAAYTNWLSPFKPQVSEMRPVILILGPATPVPFNIITYLTFFNAGATSGVVNDLLLEIEFPKGKAIMEPLVFAKVSETYRDAQKGQFSPDDVEGPYTPIFLAGRAQVTKAVSFCPGLGVHDFDMSLVEVGQHAVRVFARYNLAGKFTKIGNSTIIIEPDVLSNWKSGKTQVFEFRHRDTEIKKLPRG
jgi:hypothetical protein